MLSTIRIDWLKEIMLLSSIVYRSRIEDEAGNKIKLKSNSSLDYFVDLSLSLHELKIN